MEVHVVQVGAERPIQCVDRRLRGDCSGLEVRAHIFWVQPLFMNRLAGSDDAAVCFWILVYIRSMLAMSRTSPGLLMCLCIAALTQHWLHLYTDVSTCLHTEPT